MAKSDAVWGIDIGQCALRALRCRAHEKEGDRIVVEAFDYIEYPKILSQPEADRETLIREALEQFVSRNEVAGDRVAISVPGQSGLARFIKLPPVESKKIPDIVKYEARQQIPFALEDVVWDYQPLAGGSQDEGYALETEVGLFAMKRDQVARALKPLEEAGIPVDFIQLAPLAIYNFICFDRLHNLTDIEQYDPKHPPPSTVVIFLGTETTDLVITDGYRVWQRNIPIGGSHFTKSLTKELKLTFAKAEHLKRNATKSENPKALFQAMRPVFSDLVAEIQRSIGFFTSNNRSAKLGEVIALGNPMKLPGLQRYLSQNLDQEVKSIDDFQALMGGTVTASPQFQENRLSFGVAYGLCVQALGYAQIKTNLLPQEIVTSRLIKAKKPWAVAAAAMLLVGVAINYASHYSTWQSATVDNPEMASALAASKRAVSEAGGWASTHQGLKGRFDTLTQTGQNLQSNVDGRLLWLELLKAVDAAMPRDGRPADDREETAEDITQRPELHITSMDCEQFDDVSQWYAGVAPLYDAAKQSMARLEGDRRAAAAPEGATGAEAVAGVEGADVEEGAIAEATPADPYAVDESGMGSAEGAGGVSGPGWVIQLIGYHFHNNSRTDQKIVEYEGKQFIESTFCEYLENGSVRLPDGPDGKMVDVPISALGISHPVVVTKERIEDVSYLAEPGDAGEGGRPAGQSYAIRGGRGGGAAPGAPAQPKTLDLRQYDFVIQFCWQPKPRGERPTEWAQQQGELPETASLDGAGANSRGDSS
jgi:type IV pilus assembly protein PilM